MTISATATTQSLVGSPRASRVAAARWQEWRPLWLLWNQFNAIRQDEESARQVHATYLAWLLAMGIPIRQVRRLSLDDPREDIRSQMERAQRYLDRRLQRAHQR